MAYVLSYFTASDEALHLALSEDGTAFRHLNDGRPILRSSVGSGSIRDPFIGRSTDGTFQLLGTDGWRSRSIVHATSRDLLSWSPAELLPVMSTVEGAFNAWAPEFFWDRGLGKYVLIWSSAVGDGSRRPSAHQVWEDPDEPQAIWSCTSEDFVRFSAPSVFFSPGYSVIDATVVADQDSYLMAYKDERGENSVPTEHKNVRFARFETAAGPVTPWGEPVPASPVEGPTLYKSGRNWTLLVDRFLEHRYAAFLSDDDAHTWTPAPVTLIPGMRHASVLHVPADDPVLESLRRQ